MTPTDDVERSTLDIDVEALTEALVPSLIELFEASSSSCFCRYWHFVGTKNEWLDRCANRPEENAAELTAAVRAGDPSARALVAIEKNQTSRAVVGFMKLTARIHLPKLRALPVYRSLDLGDETTTWSIGCILIHPKSRGRGVARALVTAAPRFGELWGASAIEAYPRRSSDPLYPEEAWQGPERVFVEAGFEAVHDVPPYPVYRKRIP